MSNFSSSFLSVYQLSNFGNHHSHGYFRKLRSAGLDLQCLCLNVNTHSCFIFSSTTEGPSLVNLILVKTLMLAIKATPGIFLPVSLYKHISNAIVPSVIASVKDHVSASLNTLEIADL